MGLNDNGKVSAGSLREGPDASLHAYPPSIGEGTACDAQRAGHPRADLRNNVENFQDREAYQTGIIIKTSAPPAPFG